MASPIGKGGVLWTQPQEPKRVGDGKASLFLPQSHSLSLSLHLSFKFPANILMHALLSTILAFCTY